MGKFAALIDSVYSVFAQDTWKAENIKTFPVNFIPVEPGKEYLRMDVIPSSVGVNLKSSSGVLMIDLFVPAGGGLKRTSEIADKLDEYLVGKQIDVAGGRLQCSRSTLSRGKVDSENPALYRSTYTINFNFFGA